MHENSIHFQNRHVCTSAHASNFLPKDIHTSRCKESSPAGHKAACMADKTTILLCHFFNLKLLKDLLCSFKTVYIISGKDKEKNCFPYLEIFFIKISFLFVPRSFINFPLTMATEWQIKQNKISFSKRMPLNTVWQCYISITYSANEVGFLVSLIFALFDTTFSHQFDVQMIQCKCLESA